MGRASSLKNVRTDCAVVVTALQALQLIDFLIVVIAIKIGLADDLLIVAIHVTGFGCTLVHVFTRSVVTFSEK